MKKLLIAASVLCAATFAQAAAVNWDAGALSDSTGAGVTTAGQITGYLWEIQLQDYSVYAAMDSVALSQRIATKFLAGDLGDALVSKGNTYTERGGAALNMTGADAWGSGDTAYGLLLYIDPTGSEEVMYMANVAAAPFTSPQDVDIGELASIRGGSDGSGATAWAAAPEPTSGLLVLMGLAGLMLRRKRA